MLGVQTFYKRLNYLQFYFASTAVVREVSDRSVMTFLRRLDSLKS